MNRIQSVYDYSKLPDWIATTAIKDCLVEKPFVYIAKCLSIMGEAVLKEKIMKVLLSIRPQFVDQIFEGKKKFEYRRSIFKRTDIESVLVYASSPVQKIVGEIFFDKIIYDELGQLWDQTRDHSGISEKYFRTYFVGKEKGYAIAIRDYQRFESPLNLQEKYGVTPPQSFMYIAQ